MQKIAGCNGAEIFLNGGEGTIFYISLFPFSYSCTSLYVVVVVTKMQLFVTIPSIHQSLAVCFLSRFTPFGSI